ncbi:MAG: metallopeptidase TldD-related protein [Treponema sp.]|nr:metallopeptidase TldD-related protein [Treponema sp.]
MDKQLTISNQTLKEAAHYALDSLKKAGADKAACKANKGRQDEFNVEANKFSLMRTLFNDELTLKVIKDNRKGITKINKMDKDSIDKAVTDCITLASGALPDEAEDIAEKIENKTFDQTIGGNDMEKLFGRTKDFLEQLKDEYPKIVLEGMTTDFNSEQTIYVNSNGVEFTQSEEYYSAGTMFSAKDGEKSSSFNYSSWGLSSLDRPFMDLDMHRTLLSESEQSLDPRMVEDKFTGKIIVTPACNDMIWETIVGCFLCERALVEGTSRWKDSLGTKVADSSLTFSVTPFNPAIIAGERFTADGYESKDMDFIRDGILKSFALSLYGSRKTGKPRALTLSQNIEVAAGNTPLAEMIKGIDKGILLNRFSGASPGISGDVSGVAKNSFLIENGAITGALKETMVSFNILDVLKKIDISKERSFSGYSILPWCCFEGVTISGAQ